MRPSTVAALVLLGAAAIARPAGAQAEMIGFEKVQQLLAGNQSRQAARELSLVSVEFRNEIGRCRDESIGARLMELEPRFSTLAERINAGTITTAALQDEFTVMDRLLAENHLQLAVSGWAIRRFGRLEGVANDLRLAAQYTARTAKWTGKPLAPDLQQAVDGALAAAGRQAASPAAPLGETGDAIEALAKAFKAPR